MASHSAPHPKSAAAAAYQQPALVSSTDDAEPAPAEGKRSDSTEKRAVCFAADVGAPKPAPVAAAPSHARHSLKMGGTLRDLFTRHAPATASNHEHGTYEHGQQVAAAAAISHYLSRTRSGWLTTKAIDRHGRASSIRPDRESARAGDISFGGFADVESYQYVGEDSRAHLDMRIAHHLGDYKRRLNGASVAIVVAIGLVLGGIAVAQVAFMMAQGSFSIRPLLLCYATPRYARWPSSRCCTST